jgi:hypothetical protein
MTERTPEERRPRLNDDEPEVEGHRFHGPEETSEAGRVAALNEDADEGSDESERRPR